MKKIITLLFLSSIAFAQNSNRKYIAHSWKNNVLEITTSDGNYSIKPYSNEIIETSFVPNGQQYNPNSHAVVLKPKKFKVKFSKSKTTISLQTNALQVNINLVPFQIQYIDNQGKLLLSEKNGYVKKDSTEVLDFNISSEDILYGGGARALGMNRRGNRLQLYNRAHYGYETRAELMNFCIPLVLSSKLFAVHFDNAAIGHLDLDSQKNNTLSYETISGRKTYQVIASNTWEKLIQNYTDLTGKQPLPPRWTFGNFSSRFGYHNQDEVNNTIRKFEEDKIPVDAIILDLYWFGKSIKGTMGNLEWDKDNFPDPKKMISDLKSKGVKTILITEPFILTTSSKWQETVDKQVLATLDNGKPATWDFYFGNTGIIDVFKPEGKDWFWNIYKNLINQGVGGLWGDLGEPEVFPSMARTYGGKADEVHNIYGHQWAKIINDGYTNNFPKQRPFILMRAGYSGSQRFGMIPWSGDVSRSWGGLQSQMEIALQMGMQGMAYMHSDLGGFAGDYFDNELYLRWLQYGVFQPVFRPHAQEEVASEVARKDIITKAKAKKSVALRYQLLPYNYTLAFENNTTGIPLMKPLFFEEPNNINLLNESESYLWGNHFLIKPITKPNVTSTEVYFPKNNNWFDFYTDKKFTGGTSQKITVSSDYIPTFVRGGSFIPMIKTIQNTTAYSLENFDLHFYFDENTNTSSGQLYHDNGETPNAYEKGEYELLQFHSSISDKSVTIQLKSQVGKNFTATSKTVHLALHNLQPKRIILNGKEITSYNDAEYTIIPIIWNASTVQEIKIEY
jgi:oligosaccharide 4-alpha-D-glucosyltransferase